MGASRATNDERPRFTQPGEAARLRRKEASFGVSSSLVESKSARTPNFPQFVSASSDAPGISEGGDIHMTFSDLVAYFNARFKVEEGQTMAEYGVVLAVIAVATVAAFTALSGGITNAINSVVSHL
jgi:Flp pilus assembly pilin Flp